MVALMALDGFLFSLLMSGYNIQQVPKQHFTCKDSLSSSPLIPLLKVGLSVRTHLLKARHDLLQIDKAELSSQISLTHILSLSSILSLSVIFLLCIICHLVFRSFFLTDYQFGKPSQHYCTKIDFISFFQRNTRRL